MPSNDYWRKREDEALKHYQKQEAEYDKEIKRIYQNQLDAIQTQINDFYGRYASKEGISISDAKKRVSKLDIEAYERKAAKYVAEKNFSDKANEEMRLYNLTMKINRLEMLKANIGLELIAGNDELEKYMAGILKGRTEEELKRQAGILGETIKNNAKLVDSVVNASFHNATFSDRIWMHQDLLKNQLSGLLQSGMIQGKNPRVLARELKRAFNTNTFNAERLMRTELARVQTEAQKQSFERNGFDKYTFHANHNCCDICQRLDGKHFNVKDMMPGENASPMHPHCRCSASAYEDSAEYEAWLDYLDKGGTIKAWNTHGKADWMQSPDGLTKTGEKSIIIAKSVGAAAKNYPVKLLNSKQHVKLAEGQEISGVTFAGKGTKTEIRERFRLENDYKIPADKWEKVSGIGYILIQGKKVKAEIHWYEANGEVFEMKVKRYLNDES